ncbi:hypothetical protein [Campylobacter showae]|nr:hypothetical protein [Campylobacter showae]
MNKYRRPFYLSGTYPKALRYNTMIYADATGDMVKKEMKRVM